MILMLFPSKFDTFTFSLRDEKIGMHQDPFYSVKN